GQPRNDESRTCAKGGKACHQNSQTRGKKDQARGQETRTGPRERGTGACGRTGSSGGGSTYGTTVCFAPQKRCVYRIGMPSLCQDRRPGRRDVRHAPGTGQAEL